MIDEINLYRKNTQRLFRSSSFSTTKVSNSSSNNNIGNGAKRNWKKMKRNTHTNGEREKKINEKENQSNGHYRCTSNATNIACLFWYFCYGCYFSVMLKLLFLPHV
jgi:hypothetical protein